MGKKFTDKEWEKLDTIHGVSEKVVLDLLKKKYPSALTANEITNELEINIKTVYHHLRNLFKNEKISRKKPYNRFVKNRKEYRKLHGG